MDKKRLIEHLREHIEPISSSDDGTLRGGFTGIDDPDINYGNNVGCLNNKWCSNNTTCFSNGTCFDNSPCQVNSTCNGNGHCINLACPYPLSSDTGLLESGSF